MHLNQVVSFLMAIEVNNFCFFEKLEKSEFRAVIKHLHLKSLTFSIEKMKLVFHGDCRHWLRDITDNTGIKREAVRLIVTKDLGTAKVVAKVVPKNLTSDQKLTPVCICVD